MATTLRARKPAPTTAPKPLTKAQVAKLLVNQQPGVHSLLAWCARVERDRRVVLAKAS